MLASQGPVVSVSGGLKLWWGRLAWRRPKATRANLQPNFRERLGLPRSACPSKAGRAYALPAEDPDPRITAMSPRQSHRQKVFTQVNEATKWAVTAAVALVLLWRHDVHSMWSVVGCVASSFICKVLKKLINQQRPEGARKTDGGMPSSHANNLGFLSTYVAVACWHALPGLSNATAPLATSAGVMLVALFLAYLRIATGYHSTAQVAVGFSIGALSSIAWHTLGLVTVLDPSHQGQISYLQIATGCTAVIWALVNVRQWLKETLPRQQDS